jgi:hypothetical protein
MAFLTGAAGFLISFFMLRRSGSVGRHIGAFVLGMAVSLFLFGIWVASIIPPGGNYRTEWLWGIWLFAIAVSLALQIAAMLIAMFLRRRAAAKDAP